MEPIHRLINGRDVYASSERIGVTNADGNYEFDKFYGAYKLDFPVGSTIVGETLKENGKTRLFNTHKEAIEATFAEATKRLNEI